MSNSPIFLKALSVDDVSETYVSWLNDPEMRKYMGLRHLTCDQTAEDARSFIRNCIAEKRYHWGIFFEGKHIGNVSCSAWNLNDQWIDISFFIGSPGLHGKGLATASVGAAIHYLFKTKRFRRVQASAILENTGSTQVMGKLGMRKEAHFIKKAKMPDSGEFLDEVTYAILSEEWDEQSKKFADTIVEKMSWEKV